MATHANNTYSRRKQNLQSNKFGKKYRRVTRENCMLSEDNVSDELNFAIVPPQHAPNQRYMATKDEPKSDLVLLHSVNLEEMIDHLNQVLLFRMLKLMYGEPDILVCWFSAPEDGGGEVKGIGGFQVNWGYNFRITENLIGEIRPTLGNEQIQLWSDPLKVVQIC